MIFTIGGDFAVSPSRGEPHNWMVREKNSNLSLKQQIIFASCRKFKIRMEPAYRNYPFVDIALPEYSDNYKEPFCYPVLDNPFKNIGNLFHPDGINFINLESPFTNVGRHIGDHKSNPDYLNILTKYNIQLVSVANNHIFDQGESGFLDTVENLNKKKIAFIGGGYDFETAIKPVIIEKEDQTFAFFGFCDHCNSGYISLVRQNAPGMLPLYYNLMKKCIDSVRGKVDFICVYLHYGLENTSYIHPMERKIAHYLIDQGTDIVIGGHSHVPKGVELYKNKPILYSQGNLVFGYSLSPWGNNTITQLEITDKKIKKIKIYEIESENENIICPNLINDLSNVKRLFDIQKVSNKMKANFEFVENHLECTIE